MITQKSGNSFTRFSLDLDVNTPCNTALACLTNSWLTAMNKSEVFGVVFLDLKKGFNLVDHHILLKKLAIYLMFSTGF